MKAESRFYFFLFRIVPGPEWQQPSSCYQAEDGSARADAECFGPAQAGKCPHEMKILSLRKQLNRISDLMPSWITSVVTVCCHSVANRDRDGRLAHRHGLRPEEPDRRRTGRLEEKAADRLHRRPAQHLPGPARNMVTISSSHVMMQHAATARN